MWITFITVLTALFAFSGLLSFAAYLPTIRDLWNGKPSANVSSYVLWAFTTFIAALYGHFVLFDPYFILFADLNFFACAISLLLRLRLPRPSPRRT